MKKLYLLITLILLSCSQSANKENFNPSKKLSITIGNENFEVINDKVNANENCDNIFVTASPTLINDLGFRIKFRLTKLGILQNITLYNYRESNREYQTPDFKPSGTMVITNFKYESTTQYLYFEYEGNLVEVESDFAQIGVNKPYKYIKGKVEINNIINTSCANSTTKINYQNNNINFFTIDNQSIKNLSLIVNQYEFNLFSNNGLRIKFKNSDDLWNQNIGQYNFTETTVENRIDFEQYIGNIRATQLLWLRPIDWKNFSTTGNYIIQQKTIINNQKLTKGEFNLNVYENNQLLYSISNAKFEILGF